MKHLLLFLFILSIYSCGKKQTISEGENSAGNGKVGNGGNARFDDFLNNLPSHELPIRLNCGLPDYVWSKEFNEYKEFLPAGYDAVYGRIGQTENFKCIMVGKVGDDIYPTLFTYDNRGEKIDSLFLILRSCGAADNEQIPHSIAFIKDDLTIELTDTTRLIHYPEKSESGNDYIVDSLRISHVSLKVDENGRFVKQ